jgi:hypothetical protein
MPVHSSLLRADCVNLSAMLGIHVFGAASKDVDGQDIQREDALRAFGPAMTESPHSDLSMFQKIGVAGPSSTPVSDFRHALGCPNCPSGI